MDRTRAESTSTAGRWKAELKFLLGAAAGLVVLVAALIAEALWGNGVMAAIILTAVAVALVVHYAPRVVHRHPRTH